MNTRKNLGVWLVAALLFVTSLGCRLIQFDVKALEVGELITETLTIDSEGARAAQVSLTMAAGELEVGGGAAALMEAKFTYNVAEWTPEVSYTVDDEGRLTVRQPEFQGLPGRGRARNEWVLAFSEDMPLDMRVEYGAGTCALDLGRLQVTRLSLNLGAGDAAVDFGGNTTLEDLKVDVGIGNLQLDLTGDWQHDVAVNIQGGIGSIEILLPADIGTRVSVSQGIGNVNVRELSRRDGVYVNALYGESDATLDITVQAGLGNIDISVAGD